MPTAILSLYHPALFLYMRLECISSPALDALPIGITWTLICEETAPLVPLLLAPESILNEEVPRDTQEDHPDPHASLAVFVV